MKAKIHVTLKNGVLDPQGKAIEGSLSHLGFDGVSSVRQGKYFEIEGDDLSDAKVRDMCEKLLANMVIENYEIEVISD